MAKLRVKALFKAGDLGYDLIEMDLLRRYRAMSARRTFDSPLPDHEDGYCGGVIPPARAEGELLRDLERGFLLATLEGDLREGRSGRPGTRWRGMGWEVRDGSCVGPCRRLVFLAEPAELLEGILEVSARLRFSLRQGVAVGSPDLLIRRR